MSKVVLHVEDGRAIARGEGWGPEDWGKVYSPGDLLPCCGCSFGSARSLASNPCECRCHETSRAWLPK